MHVDRAFFDESMIAPDFIEQLRARKNTVRMRHQETQQFELGLIQFDFLAIDGNLITIGIDLNQTVAKQALAKLRYLAP